MISFLKYNRDIEVLDYIFSNYICVQTVFRIKNNQMPLRGLNQEVQNG